jgi:hypothetical protein
MLFRVIKEDLMEASLGAASLASALGYNLYHMFAQASVPASASIVEILGQLGGFGIAVWLVIHHTMVTIPRMTKEHREERAEILARFEKNLEEKRLDYQRELQEQRKEFAAMLEKASCKYKG